MFCNKNGIKKILLGITLTALTLGVSAPAMAQGDLSRISGSNRYITSQKIRDLTQGVETIILKRCEISRCYYGKCCIP